jgi:hypothetical protein
MKPEANKKQITVYGEPDPILQAYTGTENSPVIAAGPIFSEGGLCHFIVRILTIDCDRCLLPDDKQTVYNGWLSVGITENQQITLNGKQIPIQIISYYDNIKDFNFDPNKKEMQFTMPSNWNTTRLEEQKQVLVHQEISIPKQSELASKSYIRTINGIDVTKNLMIDPTNRTKDVVHFMIPKPVVIQIAQQVNKNGTRTTTATAPDSLMRFTLEPSGNISSSTMAGMHAKSLI